MPSEILQLPKGEKAFILASTQIVLEELMEWQKEEKQDIIIPKNKLFGGHDMQKFGNDGTEFWWNDEVQNLGLKIGVFFVSFFLLSH